MVLDAMKNNLLSEHLVYNGESETPTHFHLCTYDAKSFEETSADDFASIEQKLLPGRIHWLQIHGLRNTETVRRVCAHFQISFLTMQDILNVGHPSKIEERESYNVVISKLSAVPTDEEDGDIRQTHLCLVQGNGFVLTFMEEENRFFDDVVQAIRGNILKVRERNSDFLLSVLFNSLVGNYVSVVSRIDDDLEELESALFENADDRDTGIRIRLLRKQYLVMKQTVYPLKEQFSRLLHSDSVLLQKNNRAFFNDVNDHLLYVVQTIDSCRETLSSLMDLYISNNDLRMNDIMTRLTVVSTIFIPLTFLAGVWGMNFKWMPELDWRYGYLLAWGIMLVLGVAVALYLKRKKWK